MFWKCSCQSRVIQICEYAQRVGNLNLKTQIQSFIILTAFSQILTTAYKYSTVLRKLYKWISIAIKVKSKYRVCWNKTVHGTHLKKYFPLPINVSIMISGRKDFYGCSNTTWSDNQNLCFSFEIVTTFTAFEPCDCSHTTHLEYYVNATRPHSTVCSQYV